MNKKRILLIRSQDILTDSRVQRYENGFIENNIPYKILGWDRENKNITRVNTEYCRINAGYNLGTQGIKYRIKWNIFIFKYLIKNHKEYDIIHACDFDTIMPSIVMKLFRKYIIFDIFDWFSDEVKTGKKIIDYIINTLEKLSVKLANLTILCEYERLKQIKVIPKNYIVIPNIPNITDYKDKKDSYLIDKNNKLNIGYIGGFYQDRGLNEILDVISELNEINLYIAGYGNKNIEDKANEYSNKYSNINYFGKVEYDEAIEIMSQCDILYAMYYKNNKNNIYAAPNKFYEAIFLRKPIITTKGTLVGEKVINNNIGYAIEEGIFSLRETLKIINKKELKKFDKQLEENNKIYKNKFKECFNKYKNNIEKI